jgi:hypothetical protein
VLAPGTGCTQDVIWFADGTRMPPVPHDGGSDCHACLAPPGGLHHPGCVEERCPACNWSLLRCPCFRDGAPSDKRWNGRSWEPRAKA